MVVEANEVDIFDVRKDVNIKMKPPNKPHLTGMENASTKSQRLECIYEDEPLSF